MAFPPTVRPATMADMTRGITCLAENVKCCMTCTAMVAEAEPDTTPQMSPTTSLQMELTRSAFRSSLIDYLAPGTFRAAME